MNRNNDCPCNGCTERWVDLVDDKPRTCHGTCPRYAAWVEQREAKRAEAMLRLEANRMTHAKQKCLWKSFRRDNSGAFKKFSQ